jgi:hypothetical protein
MGRVNLVVDDVPEGNEPLPVDLIYDFRVDKIEVRHSKAEKGGRPFMNAELKVVNNPKYANYTVFEIWPVIDPDERNALLALPDHTPALAQEKEEALKTAVNRCFRTGQAGRAMRVKGKELTADALQPVFLGATFQARVKTEEYNGQRRSKIDSYVIPK